MASATGDTGTDTATYTGTMARTMAAARSYSKGTYTLGLGRQGGTRWAEKEGANGRKDYRYGCGFKDLQPSEGV